VAVPTVAVLLLAYAAVSARLRPTVVTQAMVFVACGLLVGNRVLDLVDVDLASQYVRLLAEATLALVLFTDAVRIDLGRLRREFQLPVRLLGIGLPLTIVAGTLAGLALFPALDLWTAAALATMLAPTDAALGLPVVSNRRLPSRIRQGLNVESGLNDGVCVPLLIIFLAIAEAEKGAGHVEPVKVVLEEIGFGGLGGILAGLVGAWLLRTFAAKGWIDQTWQQIIGVATPLLAYTVASALGGSGSIAAFVAGIVFGAIARDRAEHSTFLGGAVRRTAERRDLPVVRGRAARAGPERSGLAGRPVCGAQPDRGAHGSSRPGLARHRYAPGHRWLPRLVRTARSGLDRVRADPPRGDPTPRTSTAPYCRHLDRRSLRLRSRTHRIARREPLRRLVRQPQLRPPDDARERPGTRAPRPRPRACTG